MWWDLSCKSITINISFYVWLILDPTPTPRRKAYCDKLRITLHLFEDWFMWLLISLAISLANYILSCTPPLLLIADSEKPNDTDSGSSISRPPPHYDQKAESVAEESSPIFICLRMYCLQTPLHKSFNLPLLLLFFLSCVPVFLPSRSFSGDVIPSRSF